jgi:hypothetical protein
MFKIKLVAAVLFLFVLGSAALMAQDETNPITSDDLTLYKNWCVYLSQNSDDNGEITPELKDQFLASVNISELRLSIISERIAFALYAIPPVLGEPPSDAEVALINADKNALEKAIFSGEID